MASGRRKREDDSDEEREESSSSHLPSHEKRVATGGGRSGGLGAASFPSESPPQENEARLRETEQALLAELADLRLDALSEIRGRSNPSPETCAKIRDELKLLVSKLLQVLRSESRPEFLRTLHGVLHAGTLAFLEPLRLEGDGTIPQLLIVASSTSEQKDENLAPPAAGPAQPQKGEMERESSLQQKKERENQPAWPVFGQLARHIAHAESLSQRVEDIFVDPAAFADGFSALASSLGLALIAPVGDGLARLRWKEGRYYLVAYDPETGEEREAPTDLASLQLVELPKLEPLWSRCGANYGEAFRQLPGPLVYSREALCKVLQNYLGELYKSVASSGGFVNASGRKGNADFAAAFSSVLHRTGLRVLSPKGHSAMLLCWAGGTFQYQFYNPETGLTEKDGVGDEYRGGKLPELKLVLAKPHGNSPI